MKIIKLNKNINYFGELSDCSLENEFIQKNMKKTINNIKIIAVFLGILNSLFFIPDYFFVEDSKSFMLICFVRILIVFIIAFLVMFINRLKSYKAVSFLITTYETIIIMSFIFIIYKYDNPDYLIQAFGVMVLILSIFMVPNRFVNKIAVSLLVIAFFNLMSLYYIRDIDVKELYAVIVYLLIVLILSCISSFRDDYYKRVHYIYNKELIRLSTTDPLTGVFNRAKYNQEIKRCIDYSKRYSTPLTVIIIDFDDFKTINDTYGHLAGDDVLIQFVDIVRHNIREIDIFARWGGEEFVILLPNTDFEHGMLIAERLRDNIERHAFEDVRNVTCSFGVTQLIEDDNTESFMLKADKMLYESKSKGKNTVSGYFQHKD